MSIDEIERRLATAQERRDRAMKALAPRHKGNEWEEYLSASNTVLRLERELAAARGEEHAIPMDFPVRWESGAPRPHLLRNEHKTFLAFHLRKLSPYCEGSLVAMTPPADGSVATLALVEFVRCVSAKLGAPNDEVHEGHPLDGRGLEAYTAQQVVNSRWLAELEAINRVHRGYDPAFWRRKSHYVFWFHDSTFECIAESLAVELHGEDLAGLLAQVGRRLIS